MSEDDSPDEAYDLIRKALYVQRPTRRIDLKTEPQDGHEFIHKSRLENTYLKFYDGKVDENELLDENEDKLLKQFARKKVEEFSYHATVLAVEEAKLYLKKKFPRKLVFPGYGPSCIQKWCTFCLGSKLCSEIYNEGYEEPIDEIEGHTPFLSIVLHLNTYRAFTVLKFLHEWFLSIGMEESLGSWVYAVLACITKPLDDCGKEILEIFHKDCIQRLKDCDDLDERSRLHLISAILEYYFDINSA